MAKRKMCDDIYTIAAIETIINGKTETDLGDYTLQYQLLPVDYIDSRVAPKIDLALGILVRMLNNKTQKFDWGHIYYKPLVENKTVSQDREYAIKVVSEVLSESNEEKLNFIFKPETMITKKPYVESDLIRDYQFFEDFWYIDPVFKLSGYNLPDRVPIRARNSIRTLAEYSLSELSNNSKDIDKVKKI